MRTHLLGKATTAAESLPELAVIHWPGPVGRRLRYWYYKRRLRHLGKNVVFEPGVHILNPSWVSIGDNSCIDFYSILVAGPPGGQMRKVTKKRNEFYPGGEGELHIGRNCHIAPYSLVQAHGGVWIGDNASIASGVKIYSLSHHYRDLSNPADTTRFKFSPMVAPEEQALIMGAVVLEDNSGVGLHSILLPGATVREYSWVGVSSLLTETLEPGVIAQGTPAAVTRRRWSEAKG